MMYFITQSSHYSDLLNKVMSKCNSVFIGYSCGTSCISRLLNTCWINVPTISRKMFLQIYSSFGRKLGV